MKILEYVLKSDYVRFTAFNCVQGRAYMEGTNGNKCNRFQTFYQMRL